MVPSTSEITTFASCFHKKILARQMALPWIPDATSNLTVFEPYFNLRLFCKEGLNIGLLTHNSAKGPTNCSEVRRSDLAYLCRFLRLFSTSVTFFLTGSGNFVFEGDTGSDFGYPGVRLFIQCCMYKISGT
jgi:hypothetical protein